MKRSRPKTRWSLIAILLVAAALTYAGFRYLYPPQSAEVFLTVPSSTQYGEVTLSGTIRKDTPVGESGNYFLVLDDNRVLLILTSDDLDTLLDTRVLVTGFLDAPLSDSGLPILTVQTIIANRE